MTVYISNLLNIISSLDILVLPLIDIYISESIVSKPSAFKSLV